MNTLLLTDYYKTEHHKMYAPGTTLIYSNLTPRKSRLSGVDKVLFFGLQYFIKNYLLEKFDRDFFSRPLDEVIKEYKYAVNVDVSHIEALHKLGYLPIEIKALPEGTLCPIGVPCLTIKNTVAEFYWLTNYLETLISCSIWQPITSATIAYEYKKLLTKYAIETTGNADGVQWQGHDFSMRGMSSVESAILSAMGHLISFTGTDTIPAIYALRDNYKGEGLIGASVPATEHSVMCLGTKEDEIGTFERLLDLYPTGILSVVSDTWDLWKVCTEFLPALKEKILTREGKLVIRPDSGDPVDIICGYTVSEAVDESDIKYGDFDVCNAVKFKGKYYEYGSNYEHDCEHGILGKEIPYAATKGVIELLWDTFGGTTVKGNDGNTYKVLDSHIGAIYGDSITLDRAKEICERLKAKGFASTNVVLGIGSYTYQYNTRDTFGFAMKATYGEVKVGEETDCRQIFKSPITDDGTKKSAKGLLAVMTNPDGDLVLFDQQDWFGEQLGSLETVFLNGELTKEITLAEIKNRIK
jgi:nicotinamide phosphoribosyltransferase